MTESHEKYLTDMLESLTSASSSLDQPGISSENLIFYIGLLLVLFRAQLYLHFFKT